MRIITPARTRILFVAAGIACITLIVAVASGNSFFGISLRNDSLSDGLIGHWTFDGKYMTSNVADSSGNGNNGNLILGATGNTATTTAIGRLGQALVLDGVNDYVTIADDNSLDNGTGNFTYTLWVKAPDTNQYAALVSKRMAASPFTQTNLAICTVDANGVCTASKKISGVIYQNSLSTAHFFYTTNDVIDGNWHMVTLVRDGALSAKIYVDGVAQSLTTPRAVGNPNVTNNQPLVIGDDQSNHYLNGTVDDVRIYNRALTPEEVQRLYSLGEGVKIDASRATGGLGNGADSGLVGHWTFDGKYMNPNPQDSSGLGKHGVLTNFAANPGIIGPIGQALAFDSATDYVQIDNPDMPTGDLTISAWVRMTSFAGSPTIVMIGNGSSGAAGNEIWWGFDTGGTLGYTFDGVSGTNSNVDLPLNTWAHAVLRRSGSAVEMFLDGVLVSTFTRGQTLNYSTCPLFLGTDADASNCIGSLGNWFHGQMDDVRVYDRALSNEEVIVLYNMRGGTKIATTPQGGDLSNTVGADPYGHWTFDLADLVSGVQDVSGNGHHGQLILGSNGNTATTTATGVRGEALVFDGNDDRVQIDSPNLPTGDFTISFWAKVASYAISPSLLMIGNGGNGTAGNEIALIYDTAGNLRHFIDGDSTGVSSSKALPLNTWGHYVVRRSGSTVIMFLDGVKVSTAQRPGTLDFSTCPLHLGVDPDSGCSASLTQFFNGQLDDFRVYDYALSDGEVQALYIGDTSGNASNELVGHWTFDGKYMTPGVQDSSGNGLHGSLVNFAATTTAIGKIGQALVFDGTNDYVNIPDTTQPTEYTVSMWIKPVDTTLRNMFARTNASGPTTAVSNRLWLTSGGLVEHRVWDGQNEFVTGTTVLSPNTWYHIAGSAKNNGEVRLYVNGQEEGTPDILGTMWASGTRWLIGSNSQNSATYFQGTIDDVRLYNRQLTHNEVRRLYIEGGGQHAPDVVDTCKWVDGDDSGLIGHWTFDTANMTPNVQDSSGNGNHGTLVNFSATTTVPGMRGDALEFDGSDDYVDVGDINATDGASQMTLSAWVRADTLSNYQGIVGKSPGGASYTTRWGLLAGGPSDIGSYNNDLICMVGNGQNSYGATLFNFFNTDTWYHIGCVFDGTKTGNANRLKMYINGDRRPINFDGTIPSTTASTNDVIRIGHIDNLSQPKWDGAIDDVRIYNRALTDTEMRCLATPQ